jgi:PAS domain S-box-containing protein
MLEDLDCRALLDVLPDAIVVLDEADRIVYLNPAAERMSGHAATEWIGRASVALVRAPAGTMGQSARSLLRRADGSEMEVELTVTRRTGASGSAMTIAVIRDGRDLARLERELRTQRRLTAQYAVTNLLATAESFDDVSKAVLEAAAQTGGWQVGVLWQRSDAGLCPRAGWSTPELSAFAEATRATILATGEGAPSRALASPEPVWRNDLDGDPRRALARDIHTAVHVPIGCLGASYGVLEFLGTEEQAPDEEVLRSLATLSFELAQYFDRSRRDDDEARAKDAARFLAEASTVLTASLDYEQTLKNVAHLAVPRLADWCSVYLSDPESELRRLVAVHSNPEKTFWAEEYARRYPPDPSDPRGSARVARTGVPELHRDVTDEILRENTRDEEQLRVIRGLGIRSALIAPLSARGRHFGALGLFHAESGRRYDESDLAFAMQLGERIGYAIDNARLYKLAQEAVQVRDDFLTIASHELRTPVAALKLSVELLSDLGVLEGPDRVRRPLESIVRQTTRLENLVQELLDVSRITTKRLAIQRADVDLAELVHEIALRFGEQLARARCPLAIDGKGPLVGRWDQGKLDQVLANLISNAIKFGAGKPIEIHFGASASWAHFEVRDHGIGIAAEDQRRIFERFERAVSPRHFGGLGLGLWISRQMVEALGGTITVESELGHGSRFMVELPRNCRGATRAVAHASS